MTQDITEFLASLPVDPPRAEAPMRVTYQDSCHLVHAQRLSAPPRELLAAIPGLELVEMPHSDRCCGAGGSYQITQREMSGQLRTHKLEEACRNRRRDHRHGQPRLHGAACPRREGGRAARARLPRRRPAGRGLPSRGRRFAGPGRLTPTVRRGSIVTVNAEANSPITNVDAAYIAIPSIMEKTAQEQPCRIQESPFPRSCAAPWVWPRSWWPSSRC